MLMESSTNLFLLYTQVNCKKYHKRSIGRGAIAMCSFGFGEAFTLSQMLGSMYKEPVFAVTRDQIKAANALCPHHVLFFKGRNSREKGWWRKHE